LVEIIHTIALCIDEIAEIAEIPVAEIALISVCCLQCKICLPLLGREIRVTKLPIVSEQRKEGSEAS